VCALAKAYCVEELLDLSMCYLRFTLFSPIEREKSARDLFGLFHASTERGEQLPHGLKSMWQRRRLSLAYAYVSEREIKKMRGRRGKEERGMNRLNE